MENIDILDENGNKTGEILSREETHKKGLWHKAVHIWLVNDNNEILMQRRSPEKKTNPNKWTTSTSGHLSAGDESRTGAVRELDEEIGVETTEEELEYLFTVKEEHIHTDLINREIIDVYLLKNNLRIEDFKLQKEEVSEVKWLSFEEFKNKVKNYEQNNVTNHKEMFDKLIEELTKRHFC